MYVLDREILQKCENSRTGHNIPRAQIQQIEALEVITTLDELNQRYVTPNTTTFIIHTYIHTYILTYLLTHRPREKRI